MNNDQDLLYIPLPYFREVMKLLTTFISDKQYEFLIEVVAFNNVIISELNRYPPRRVHSHSCFSTFGKLKFGR